MLNTFEPGRLLTRVFTPVQENGTLRRYADSWSRLLFFLFRMQSPEHQEQLHERHFQIDQIRWQYMQQLSDAAEEACNTTQPALAQERVACSLKEKVAQLSTSLVRHMLYEAPLRSPVVRYCAFYAVDAYGAWLPAQRFAPFLSGMIYCMQLWLIHFCIEQTKVSLGILQETDGGEEDEDSRDEGEQPESSLLESNIQNKCSRFLTNNTHSPIAELSH